MKQRVLFVCIHNSARSQMAEALLNHACPEFFAAESAGLEPGSLNPFAVEVLRERGLDISGQRTRSVDEVADDAFDFVITVCDEGNAAGCPAFSGGGQREHWSFPDPSALTGTDEERLAGTRAICGQIAERIEQWCIQKCGRAETN
ncbi:MAG: arsenate reductase ArsC [Verrucomicrobiota bacterium]|nr:arsenate reductase ArsC [Verrucomicrobiota bacterium]